jgi:hypothetical protein
MYEYRANGGGVDTALLERLRSVPFTNGLVGALMLFMCSFITDRVSFMTGESTFTILLLFAIGVLEGSEVRSAIGDAEDCCGVVALLGRCVPANDGGPEEDDEYVGIAVGLLSCGVFGGPSLLRCCAVGSVLFGAGVVYTATINILGLHYPKNTMCLP